MFVRVHNTSSSIIEIGEQEFIRGITMPYKLIDKETDKVAFSCLTLEPLKNILGHAMEGFKIVEIDQKEYEESFKVLYKRDTIHNILYDA
jgi:hypothetical protein